MRRRLIRTATKEALRTALEKPVGIINHFGVASA
jgi:hypothetical protein